MNEAITPEDVRADTYIARDKGVPAPSNEGTYTYPAEVVIARAQANKRLRDAAQALADAVERLRLSEPIRFGELGVQWHELWQAEAKLRDALSPLREEQP